MPTQIASDSFNRALLGTNWTQTNVLATLGIVSSTAVAIISGALNNYGAIYWSGAGTFQNSQYSQITLTSLGNSETANIVGPAVLISSSANSFYWAFYYSGSLFIDKVLTGAVGLISTPYTPALNDVIEISAVPGVSSTVLTVYVNGVQKLTYTDSSSPLLTGTPGIGAFNYASGSTQWQATPWSAGDNATLTYSISGTILDGSSNPVVGATVACTGQANTTTASDGTYSFSGLSAGSYTVTPTKTGWTFAPPSANETIVASNITGVNFTGTNTPVATTTFSPVAGAYGPAQTVTFNNTNSGLSGFAMYYTTDGSTPTTGSTLYSAPITVNVTETVEVLAVATGYANSAIASAAYTINGAVTAATFSPVAGTYTSTQSVTLLNADSALPGFAMYYTTDGSTPTISSTLYSGAITVSASETIKVLAVATGYANSTIASAMYTINSATAYSVPDCRVVKPNSATGVTTQGTVFYDQQTSSNSAIPPTDSRAAGAPVGSRNTAYIPQNSRSQPPFED